MLPRRRRGFALTISLGFISNFLKAAAFGIDYSQCALNANQTYRMAPNASFLYDQYGKPTNHMTQAWGISYEFCKDFCDSPVNTNSYDWNQFSNGFISWLLPWLALTAQLPFGTRDKQTNFMALLLAIGSPSLITFSLVMTILNARQINQKFRQVKEENQSLRPNRPLQTEAIKSARCFLIDSQQIPIQIFNGPHREIAHLIACPENWAWWHLLRIEIQKTKRGWTYPLYAQIGWVCVAQLLAIVTFFTSASFDTSIGIGLAINSLWVWMIPVILGWVYVGTQTSAGSINAALSNITVPILGQETNVRGTCIGIRDRTTFDESFAQPQKSAGKCDRCKKQTSREQARISPQQDIEMQGCLEDERRCNCTPHTFLGFHISGCDVEPGSIFNYARTWSHMNVVQHVVNAFRAVTYWQKERRSVNGDPWQSASDKYDENFRGSPEELSMYISELGKDQPDFSVHRGSSSELVLNFITAILITIFLQWSSTGAAIFIAYKTPVVGLGCQSGSYLVYGIFATLSWLLLALSAFLSNHWLIQKEKSSLKPHPILGPSAVITRITGKSLAAANGLFLVVTCVIQFTGLYDTCWCDACIPSLGEAAGWVILFASDAQIAAAGSAAWKGGVALSILSSALATCYFFNSRGDEIFDSNQQ